MVSGAVHGDGQEQRIVASLWSALEDWLETPLGGLSLVLLGALIRVMVPWLFRPRPRTKRVRPKPAENGG